jgi:hypothetical protein
VGEDLYVVEAREPLTTAMRLGRRLYERVGTLRMVAGTEDTKDGSDSRT